MTEAGRARPWCGAVIMAFAASTAFALLAPFAASARQNTNCADDHPHNGDEPGVKIGNFIINTNAALVSDWISQGSTQTDGGPAIQGEFVVRREGFFVGAWTSSMKLFDEVTEVTRYEEIDLNFGYEKTEKDFTFSVKGTRVVFPDSANHYYTYDYWEGRIGVAYQFTKSIHAGAGLRYSPNYSKQVGRNWIAEGNAEYELPTLGIFTPNITGEVAWQDGDETQGGADFGWWNAGLALAFAKHYKVDFRYNNTLNTKECGGEGLCGARFNAALKSEF